MIALTTVALGLRLQSFATLSSSVCLSWQILPVQTGLKWCVLLKRSKCSKKQNITILIRIIFMKVSSLDMSCLCCALQALMLFLFCFVHFVLALYSRHTAMCPGFTAVQKGILIKLIMENCLPRERPDNKQSKSQVVFQLEK